MARIDDHVRTRLAHLVDFDSSGNLSSKTYLTFPLQVTRPASGTDTVAAACGACGAQFPVVVHSARRTVRLRLLWLGLLLASLLPVAVPLLVGAPALAAANLCGMLILIIPFFALWYQEDGVRGPGRFWVRPHMLRYSPRLPPGAPPARLTTFF